MSERIPRLRSVSKNETVYPLNRFPSGFAQSVGLGLIAHVAANGSSDIGGDAWERAFANAVGAIWHPSNVGLDDVRLRDVAWGLKTMKTDNPHRKGQAIRLISGRCSPEYSFGEERSDTIPADRLGDLVLRIYNKRVMDERAKYRSLRTCVLVRSNDMTAFTVWEYETVAHDPALLTWQRNAKKNIEGSDANGAKRITWQPHGAQLTIHTVIPDDALRFTIRKPTAINRQTILSAVGADSSWVTIIPATEKP